MLGLSSPGERAKARRQSPLSRPACNSSGLQVSLETLYRVGEKTISLVITHKCQSPRERMLAGESECGSGDENGSNTCQQYVGAIPIGGEPKFTSQAA